MSQVAFIDSNVPIYASGRPHRYKEPCFQVVMMVVESPRSFVTSVEVLQELLHRYIASGRWTLGREVLQGFAEVMRDRIEPVYEQDLHIAAGLADRHSGINARDLVHAAVMQRLGTDLVISADTGFDRLPCLTRLDPADIAEWSKSVRVGDSG